MSSFFRQLDKDGRGSFFRRVAGTDMIYTDGEMQTMFGPYLSKGVTNGLSVREVKLIETVQHERTRADAAEKALEAVREPHLECWMVIHEGKPDVEAFGIGKVFGLDFDLIEDALYNIKITMESFLCDEQIPHGAGCAKFLASNFVREEGQMTFPETGQWDFSPYWDMRLELIGYDFADGKDGKK